MFYALAVICLAGKVLAENAIEAGPCPKVQPVADFKMDQYLGVWFDTIHSIEITQKAKCITERLVSDGNGTFSIISNEIQRETGAMITAKKMLRIADPAEPSKMKMKSPGIAREVDLWILETDYVSFALMYTCIDGGSRHFRQIYFITRDQKASDALVEKGAEFLDKYNFQRSNYARMKQEDCQLTASK